MEAITQEIGNRIRRLRQKQGITQEKLAEKADLHHTYIGQVERGEKNLSVATLEKILEALGITFSEFFEKVELCSKAEKTADKCYSLIVSHKEDDQKQIYAILQQIEKLIR